MSKAAIIVSVIVLSTMATGCITVRQNQPSSSSLANDQHAAESSPALSTNQAEAQQRREHSRNSPVVSFRTPCPGLFIPEVKRIMFQRVLPAYALYTLNSSEHRYDVRYDLTLSVHTRTMYGTERFISTEERGFLIRPRSFSELLLKKEFWFRPNSEED